ncbi:MAG: hypothetical protein WDM86_00340 [Rhizomicrobium sp.]
MIPIPAGAIIQAIVNGIGYLVRALYTGLCLLVASIVTPKGHRRCGEYGESMAAKELLRDRFEITPDFAVNAFSKIKKS